GRAGEKRTARGFGDGERFGFQPRRRETRESNARGIARDRLGEELVGPNVAAAHREFGYGALEIRAARDRLLHEIVDAVRQSVGIGADRARGPLTRRAEITPGDNILREAAAARSGVNRVELIERDACERIARMNKHAEGGSESRRGVRADA